jgi:hypothetical protein
MNAWDIDPNLYLPVFRSIWQVVRLSLKKLFRPRTAQVAPPPAGCRG